MTPNQQGPQSETSRCVCVCVCVCEDSPTHILPIMRQPAMEAWTTGMVSDNSPSKTLPSHKHRGVQPPVDHWSHVSCNPNVALLVNWRVRANLNKQCFCQTLTAGRTPMTSLIASTYSCSDSFLSDFIVEHLSRRRFDNQPAPGAAWAGPSRGAGKGVTCRSSPSRRWPPGSRCWLVWRSSRPRCSSQTKL